MKHRVYLGMETYTWLCALYIVDFDSHCWKILLEMTISPNPTLLENFAGDDIARVFMLYAMFYVYMYIHRESRV